MTHDEAVPHRENRQHAVTRNPSTANPQVSVCTPIHGFVQCPSLNLALPNTGSALPAFALLHISSQHQLSWSGPSFPREYDRVRGVGKGKGGTMYVAPKMVSGRVVKMRTAESPTMKSTFAPSDLFMPRGTARDVPDGGSRSEDSVHSACGRVSVVPEEPRKQPRGEAYWSVWN